MVTFLDETTEVDTIDVVGDSSHTLELSLPFPTSSNEVVTITCTSSDEAHGGSVVPSEVSFTAGATDAEVTIVPVDDGANTLTPVVDFQVDCTTSVTGTSGSYVTSGALPVSALHVQNRNHIVPVVADMKVQQRDGSLVTAVGGSPRSLAISTSGSTLMVLEASPSRAGPHFSPAPGGLSVTIAGVECEYNVTADGRTLSLRTPSYAAVCGVDGELCQGADAYKPLVITQAPDAFAYSPTVEAFSCPSNCPGDVQPRGLFYSETCVGFASGALCLSPATASQCAYGARGTCMACPQGALCPGGKRLWSQPGYFTPSEASSDIERCPEPAASRCKGWDANSGATACGTGYKQGSPRCATCANGYYDDSGQCEPCPDDGLFVGVVVPLVMLAGSAAVVFALMCTVAFCLMRRDTELENPKKAAVVHSVNFTIWMAVTLQTLVRSSQPLWLWLCGCGLWLSAAVFCAKPWLTPRCIIFVQVQIGDASSGLPTYLADTYTFISVFQLQPAFTPVDCFSGSNPFLFGQIQLGGAVFLTSLFFFTGLTLCKRRVVRSLKARKALAALRRMMVTALVLLFPVVTNTVLSLLRCERQVQVSTLDEELASGGSVGVTGETLTTRWVVSSQPDVGCLDSVHTPALLIGIAAGIGYSVAFPLVSFLHVRKASKKLLNAAPGEQGVTPAMVERGIVWGSFLDGSYKLPLFWFKQVCGWGLAMCGVALLTTSDMCHVLCAAQHGGAVHSGRQQCLPGPRLACGVAGGEPCGVAWPAFLVPTPTTPRDSVPLGVAGKVASHHHRLFRRRAQLLLGYDLLT